MSDTALNQSRWCWQQVPTLAISDSTAHRFTALDPDVRLMLRVRNDDAQAFEELVRRYQDRLIGVLEHLVRGQDQAEDLAQEVFLRVFRARQKYKPGARFSTWLFTIAHNVASNARRSRSRRKEVDVSTVMGPHNEGNPLDEMVAAASGQMPVRQLDKLERAEVVRLAVKALNDRQQMALILSKFEGLSYDDISQVMQLTPQAVKSLLSRARRNLKTLLQPYIEEGVRPEEPPSV